MCAPTGQLGERRQGLLLTRPQLGTWGSGRLPLSPQRAGALCATAPSTTAEASNSGTGQSSVNKRGAPEAALAGEAASAGAKPSPGRRRAAPADATGPVAVSKADGAGGDARDAGSPVLEAGGSAQQAEAAAAEQFWPALALSLSTSDGTVATKRAAKRPSREKAAGGDTLPRREFPMFVPDLRTA